MIVARAFPERTYPGYRPHVIDGWPRVPVDDYDYRGLADLGDDVIVMDWDVAISLEDLHLFAEHAAAHPGDVLAGANRLYKDGGPEWVWAASRYNTPEKQSMRWLEEGEPTCHLFGFGLAYLPQLLIKQFIAEHPGHLMSDVDFAGWHYNRVRQEVPVDWSVHPVHLHFEIPEGGRL